MADSRTAITDWVSWAIEKLTDAGVYCGHGCDNPSDEAVWAAFHVAGLMEYEYDSVIDHHFTEREAEEFCSLIEQRIATRKPLAYLIREAWFARHCFYIDERAIVPRSHIGDFIEDSFAPWIQSECVGRVLDLCTGSGCIAISLAIQFPDARIDAADIDLEALEVARINADRHGVSERVRFLSGDLFQSVGEVRYDLIVCNPPYVDRKDRSHLPDEYHHEPEVSLYAADRGLELVKRVLAESVSYLSPDGYLIMELGDSKGTLEAAFPSVPFMWLTSNSGQSVVLIISAAELQEISSVFEGQ